MLLSNLSSSPATCALIISRKIQVVSEPRLASKCFPVLSQCGSCPSPVPYPSGAQKAVLALPLLIDAFVQGAQVEENPSKRLRKGKLHFLASVFGNLSAVGHRISPTTPDRVNDISSRRLGETSSTPQRQIPFNPQLDLNIHYPKSSRSRNTKTRSDVEVSPPQSSGLPVFVNSWCSSHQKLRLPCTRT